MSFTIRNIETEDFEDWLRMRLSLWPAYSPEEHGEEMNKIVADLTYASFVAVRPEGRLGGFLEVSQRKYAEGCHSSPVGYIEGWYVDPDLRRQGVGRKLVHAAESWASSSGLRKMASDCELDNQTSSFVSTKTCVNWLPWPRWREWQSALGSWVHRNERGLPVK